MGERLIRERYPDSNVYIVAIMANAFPGVRGVGEGESGRVGEGRVGEEMGEYLSWKVRMLILYAEDRKSCFDAGMNEFLVCNCSPLPSSSSFLQYISKTYINFRQNL